MTKCLKVDEEELRINQSNLFTICLGLDLNLGDADQIWFYRCSTLLSTNIDYTRKSQETFS